MPSAVLFDFNGVLVDDEHIHRAAFNEVLEPLGCRMTEAAYNEKYLGFDDRGAFDAVLRDHGRTSSTPLIDSLIARKAEVYARRARTELRIFPGASRVVATVAQRRPVGIVSGALRREIESALDLMELRSAVRFIVAAEDVSACKPDPEGYRAAVAQLARLDSRLDPSHVLVVEDSLAGIAAARGANLSTLAVAHSYPRAELVAAGASVVLDAIADLDETVLARAIACEPLRGPAV